MNVIHRPAKPSAATVTNQPATPPVAPAIQHFTHLLAGVVDLEQIALIAERTAKELLNVPNATLLMAVAEQGEMARFESVRSQVDQRIKVGYTSKLFRALAERAVLVNSDLPPEVQTESRPFFEAFKSIACAPIRVQDRLEGALTVSARTSQEAFSPMDLSTLYELANQTGSALHAARLVRDFRAATAQMDALNRDLFNTRDSLKKLDSVKTDFVTIASHELRTPLAQVRGYTDFLEAINNQQPVNTDQIGTAIRNLRQATDRMETLIGDMLDVSQLDIHAMDLRFAPTTIESVMRMAIDPLTESMKQRQLALISRGLRGLPPIEADLRRLVQAFRNLVQNAIKFTPDGGEIEVSGSVQKNPAGDQDEILIALKDSGIGIDAKNQKLVFEKFFRAFDPSLHSTGSTKFMGAGPGLGLTIARGVIEGHGGRIWVESTGYDPKALPGSTFYIALPLAPPSDSEGTAPFALPSAPRI